ncbi:MAG: ABC transporter permease subunit [Oscillospiraceae bacterium]|nr:ABC transporter permease subunit [Oscillospiraceae bacterium]
MKTAPNSHLKSLSQSSQTQRNASKFVKKFNLPALILLAIVCIGWFLGAHLYKKPFVFPYFEEVIGSIAYALSDLAVLRAIGITVRRVLLGTFYGVLIGVPIGMAMGFSTTIMNALAPYVNALRQIPTTAWVPMAIIWFGLGDGPTLFVLALHGVFIVILNTAAGVLEINKEYYNAVRSMGANTLEVITDVVLPGSLPGIITGIRLALGMGWMTVV